MALKIILMSLLAFCASTSEAQQTPSQENNITLPISYPARETQGSGTTCQISEEIRENITNEILTIVQESFIPLIDETRYFTPECPCMSNGRRVAYLDMTNPDHNCPDGWREISSPRSCGRFNSISCDSAFFPTDGIAYSHVCGRVKAYKYGNVFAFYEYIVNQARTIDTHYVDGVSITHGSNPRQHVWTFAAAYAESNRNPSNNCPCTRTDDTDARTPTFIGDDYFCDTVAGYSNTIQTDNPLWDGAGCGSISTCCEFNNPPWFCKTLPQPTTDNIEVRICGYNNPYTSGGTPVELLELYVN